MVYTQDLLSKSEKKISILVHEIQCPKLTLIETHGGFTSSKEQVAKDDHVLVNWAINHKVNYIAIDLSNNGTQNDQPINELRFSNRVKDLETVIDFAYQAYNKPIVLLGSSLGGLIVLNASCYSSNIKGIILNCAAVKAHECIKGGMNEKEFYEWKEKDTANVWGIPMSYDFYEDIYNLDPIKIIPNINVPVLWFHGTSDKVVPIFQAREAKKLNPRIQLIEIKDGEHRFGDKMKKGEWEEKVTKFISDII